MENSSEKTAWAWPIAVFAATLLVLASLIVKMFLLDEISTTLVVSIVAISGLLILSPRIFELSELTLSTDGLIAKIRDVERKVETTKQEIKKTEQKIDKLFAYTMSPSMATNLRKVAAGNFGHFRNSSGLQRELRHLRDIGYIDVKGNLGDLPDEGNELSDFVTATPTGKDFLALRESMEADGQEHAD
jgi:hypothetical protein